ncbi:MAG: HD domain-containing protein, partial [Ktedonobacteraceae bacterium]|nr:HD domain-containing protein [Ktedonobacteraceae bacterium]
VSDLSTSIAQALGLEQFQISRIGMAALLHDIGKVAIPDELLQKSDRLTSHERRLLREHPELGAQILEASPFLHDLIPAVHHHHERWDGNGYPDRLAQEDIPLAARIIAVAEAYDAMVRDYPYQSSRTPTEALSELARCSGTQFDPTVVQTLSKVLADQHEQGPSEWPLIAPVLVP